METVAQPAEETDSPSTAELLALAQVEWAEPSDESPLEAMHLLIERSDPEVFQAAERWCDSEKVEDRRLAVAILRRIGRKLGKTAQPTDAFHAEAVALLVARLSDAALPVVADAAFALGERNDPAAVPPLLRLRDHPDPQIRSGVVHGLSSHDDPRAVAGLIHLSQDPVAEVRDWATFNLGTMTTVDTPELREALLARTGDVDDTTRGEALIGLANRHDERVIKPLICYLQGDYHGLYPVEAVEAFPLPVFHEYLLPLRSFIEKHHPWFLEHYEAILLACRPPDHA